LPITEQHGQSGQSSAIAYSFGCGNESDYTNSGRVADEWSIYTKDELRILVAQNRVAPLSIAELRRVHEIKRTFSGRISS
jgi:hypothetical protein